MYRVFCESYENFKNSFSDDNYRLQMSKPIELIANLNEFEKEKNIKSDLFKKSCDLLCFLEENVNNFPKFKAFLWTLKSRNILPVKYNIANKEDLIEQANLINSFLKLAYWY